MGKPKGNGIMSFRLFRWGVLLPTAAVGLVTACDTEVINPGRVQEEFLLREEAQEAIVAGIGRAVSEAQNWVGYTGAAVAREIHPSGSTRLLRDRREVAER